MIEARVDGRPVQLPGDDAVRGWTAAKGLLWLDASAPEADDLAWLGSTLALHPLVLEDLEHRNQRPKMDDYADLLFVVLFGTVRNQAGELGLCEVHVLLGDGWLATVSDVQIPALRQLWEACDKRPEICHGGPSALFYRICDSLVDSVFPILDGIDDDIDRVETTIVQNATENTVADIFRLKRELNVLRRVLGPQRDLLQILSGPRTPRLEQEAQLYLRDVYDHAVRMVEQVDSYRDIVTGALDVYLSSVSNRLGEQTRRLTIVATIFLPLTFLTGFFGMNFQFLVGSISTRSAFIGGVTAMALSVPLVLWVSQRFTSNVRPVPAAGRPGLRARRRPYTRPRRGGAAAVPPHSGGDG
jgi:magnesium transporter